ncbi:hypothetical protein GCM10027346_12100 [Hymenobacter seoulensis]
MMLSYFMINVLGYANATIYFASALEVFLLVIDIVGSLAGKTFTGLRIKDSAYQSGALLSRRKVAFGRRYQHLLAITYQADAYIRLCNAQ